MQNSFLELNLSNSAVVTNPRRLQLFSWYSITIATYRKGFMFIKVTPIGWNNTEARVMLVL